LSPITFVLLRAASGPLDELQAAASGMPVGKLDVFLNAAEIGDILAHAGSRSTVWSQFVDNRLRQKKRPYALEVVGDPSALTAWSGAKL
jgi:hypothetical protein